MKVRRSRSLELHLEAKLIDMEKHDLLHEFPNHHAMIHELKIGDHHFKKLFDEYDATNKSIHRIESGAEVTTDEKLNELRIKRVHLKDQIAAYLV